MCICLLLLTQLLAAINVIQAAAITLYWIPWPHNTYSVPKLATASFTPVGTGTDGTTYVGHVVETAALFISDPLDSQSTATPTVVTSTFPPSTVTVTLVEDASHFSQHLDLSSDVGTNRSCTIGSDAVATCVIVDYVQSAGPQPASTSTFTYTDSATPIYTLVTSGEKCVRSGGDALLLGLVVSLGISLGGMITML